MKPSSYDPETLISRWLRIGVSVSAIIIGVGVLLMIIDMIANHSTPDQTHYATINAVLAGVGSLKPAAVISLGLLCLIFTPLLRVALSILIFLKEKDYLYLVITSLVLIILILSLAFGKAL